MIRLCKQGDVEQIWAIINDGAQAYKGVIPADCWTEPYMTREKLGHEIENGVTFWGFEQDGAIQGVMGMQDVLDVTLIRHAYVRTNKRRSGCGGTLLRHLQSLTNRSILVGTWADASWAIHFYEKNGFELAPAETTGQLLCKYWKVSTRQIETSVVLWRKEIPDASLSTLQRAFPNPNSCQ